MNNCKFEEAFYSKTEMIIDLEEIIDKFKTKLAEYKELSESLYCPECQKAKLSFVNAKNPYLRTLKGSSHNENCSLNQEIMNKKQAICYIEDVKNKEAIIRQMERSLSVLFDETPKGTPKPFGNNDSKENNDLSHNNPNSKKRKRIARKRIDMPFSDEDFDCPKIFYGKVNFKWEKTNDLYKILLYSPKNNKLLCKIFVTKNVYIYIPEEYKSKKQFKCAISFLASFVNNKKTYHETHLQHSDYIKISVIEK